MRNIAKVTAIFLSVLMLLSAAVIPAGAVTVTKDGKQYTLCSHTPTTGDVNVLLIRLGFADYPADGEDDPVDSAENLLSYFDGSADSVNGYYETSSYGKLHLHCNKVYTYNAQYDRDDYDGDLAEYTLDDLFAETLTALDDEIDYADYDSNDDGELDFVVFVASGPTGEWSTTWWPHVNYKGDVTVGDKHVSTYSITNGFTEINGYKHEFGHILGAADYYSYNDGHSKAMMTFDMMSAEHSDHCGYNKWLFGWLTEEDIAFVDKAAGDTVVSLAPIETDLGDGKKIAVVTPGFNSDTRFLDEFFLVEYDSGARNNKSVFEKYEYTPGFRVFHVNAKAEYDDEDASAYFISNNNEFRLNLIHNVKNEYNSDYDPYDEMFFREGDSLTPADYPNTGFASELQHNGVFTGISFTDFVTGDEPSFKVSFTDEKPDQPEPTLTIDCNSLTSDFRLTLRSDQPIVLSGTSIFDEGYEAPYLIDEKGTKLTLDVSSSAESMTEYDVRYRNASPVIEPDSEYTLVIPEGFLLTGYSQPVAEYRQKIKTDSFLPLTQIERVNQLFSIRYSNTFAVTDYTYGRIEIDAAAKRCSFIEFNLNGEEIARTTFDVPVAYDSPKSLIGCKVYRLNDGKFALCIYTYDDIDHNYFVKIDRNGKVLSDIFTVSDEMVSGYVNNVHSIDYEPFLGGLFKFMKSSDGSRAVLLTIDFENEPAITEADPFDSYVPLDADHYLRESKHHIQVYDSADRKTADIVLDEGHIYLGAFAQGGKLKLLIRKKLYDENNNRFYKTRLETYDFDGNMIGEEDITEAAEHLLMHFPYDRVIATDSGYYLTQEDEFDGGKYVIACAGDWSKLGEFKFDRFTQLVFTGECGLTTADQYFSDEDESAYIVSRFNIGEFEIVPKRENLLGDANLDGEVDITDATTVQRYDVRMIELSDKAKQLADVDRDGDVCIIDATWIQRWDLKMKAPAGIGEPC